MLKQMGCMKPFTARRCEGDRKPRRGDEKFHSSGLDGERKAIDKEIERM